MGCGEIEDLELASMDLYSLVKLRASNAKRYKDRNGDFDNVESANARLSESSQIERANQISATVSSKKENRYGDNPLSIKKCDGFMWLLEIAKGELSSQITDKKNSIENFVWSNFSAEGIAVEMLRELSKERSSNFTVGDLVWGKIKSHPWWPGQIYDESRASPSIFIKKQKGRVLVAFFGDNTYGWLNPKNVLPFEPHFVEKSKQSQDGLFLTAIEEAVFLVKKRSALGLTCKCRNRSAFRPTKNEGFFDVDVAGYGYGNVYSMEQIEKARNVFKPHEMLSFVQKLALRPNIDVQKNVTRIRNVARALAYRKAASEEFDETYAEAFGIPAVSKEDPAKKKAHEAPYPLEESKKDDSGKQVEPSASKVQPQSSNSRVNVLQKRSLQDISMPWFREFEADDLVQPNKKRIIFDSQEKTIIKRQEKTKEINSMAGKERP